MFWTLTHWLRFSQDDALGSLSRTEAILYWVLLLTPLWWLLGIQTLFYPSVIVALLLSQWSWQKLRSIRFPFCIWAWAAMTAIAGVTALLGLMQIGFPVIKILASGVTLFKGYGMITTGLMLPFFCQIRLKVLTRAVAWMTAGYTVAIAMMLSLLFLNVWTEPFNPLLAQLTPGDKLSLRVTPAQFQYFCGLLLPRTSLYTPDPPVLGICSLLSFFICWGETNPRLRKLSCLGCLLGLLVSQSRLAWLTFPAVGLLTLCFRHLAARQTSLWGAALVNGFCAVLGMSLVEFLGALKQLVTQARPDSSRDRANVVNQTLEAWLQKPLLGWGLAQDSVRWHTYDIALGSFSTYASVLYLQGVVGFVVFGVALGSTVVCLWPGARQGHVPSQQAFAMMAGLLLLMEGLPLSWMCVYFWFFFVWLGVILAEVARPKVFPNSWQQLLALQYRRKLAGQSSILKHRTSRLQNGRDFSWISPNLTATFIRTTAIWPRYW